MIFYNKRSKYQFILILNNKNFGL
ncbi:MAG: hypothetical protein GY830_08345 [Bacteroidetes bacterium]|nr:hypothetical protein [Bacteroidota bacterium]